MTELDRDFMKEVFKETNSHLRATERKSLIVTGAYIALFSILLSSIGKTASTTSGAPMSWLEVAVQSFFLVVGSSIFIMQQWYRAWKEHYLDVCLAIRKHFLPEKTTLNFFPIGCSKKSRNLGYRSTMCLST